MGCTQGLVFRALGARGKEVGTGREDLAVPECAGPALGPFKIHLHSSRRRIKNPQP